MIVGNFDTNTPIRHGEVVMRRRADDLAAFDALPARLKDILREAPIMVDSVGVLKAVQLMGINRTAALLRQTLGALPSPYEGG